MNAAGIIKGAVLGLVPAAACSLEYVGVWEAMLIAVVVSLGLAITDNLTEAMKQEKDPQ
jgi:ammonia channel protein AmtB